MKKNIGILLIIFITSLNLHASRGFLNCLKNDVDLKKSVLIFYSPDCPYCTKMEKEIVQNEKFQELIKSKYNIQIVNIKTDAGKKIAALYKIQAVPTIVNYDQTSLVIKKRKGFGSINKLSSFLNLNRHAKTNIGNFSLSVCGDGVLDAGAGESCDDGNTTNGDGCSSTCELESVCGNGILEGNEVCDDGNTTDGDNCSSTCDAENFCGDGVLNTSEACDDGNTTNGDGCSSTCELESVCGNGILEGNEVCDDGNTIDGDNCSSTCDAENFCGDGVLNTSEACDDGNTTNGDGCSSTCELESVCGNGILEGNEVCDDGNTTDGDNCSSTCDAENFCGDGVLNTSEACDDGNTTNGDGCSSTCELESLAINEYDIAFTELKSYPIPFTNQLTVSLYLLHNSDVELLVYDITGKQVHAKTIDNVSFGKNEIVFEDIQFLQSGNYLLKINVTNQLGTYFKVSNILKK